MDTTKIHPEDTAAIDELWAMLTAAKEHDRPHDPPMTRAGFQSEIDNPSPHEHHEWHVTRTGGRIVGAVKVSRPLSDNLHLFQIYAVVLPDHRRRGIGRALLDRSVEIGRTHGCRVQTANASEPLPDAPPRTTDGRDFLLGNGFSVANTMRSRRVELSAIDGKIEQDLLDESWPRAEGYELVQWVGATPAEHAPGAAGLASRLLADVPLGDLEVEQVHYDADRYLAEEEAHLRHGNDFVCTYVRHVDSGDLVAHSVVCVQDEIPTYGWQWITLVHPDHRGHRLGMIVKIENHRLLRRAKPGVRWIETSNAEVNSHMVAINEKLGFTEFSRHLAFQREI